jgi:soluble lytic murein transglycosylase-like protein
MPTKPLFADRRTGRPGRPTNRVAGRAATAAFLAALAAIVLYVSTERLSALTRPMPTASNESLVVRQAEPAPPAPGASVLPRNADALITSLARKYRISEAATREMVHAAYVEAARNGLDPLLVIAVIGIESRFNPIAQSDGGAVGLMQVMPFHGDKFGAVDSILDPRVNIQIGAAVLRDSIRRGGTEIAGLQLYNGALDDETSAYAHKVLAEKQRLKSVIRRGA